MWADHRLGLGLKAVQLQASRWCSLKLHAQAADGLIRVTIFIPAAMTVGKDVSSLFPGESRQRVYRLHAKGRRFHTVAWNPSSPARSEGT